MAKNNSEHIEDAQVVEMTEMETTTDSNEITVVNVDEQIEKTINELKRVTVTDQALESLEKEFGNFTIAGIEDMTAYKAAKSGKSKLTKLRTSIEARRKELIEPALKWQRDVNAEAARITDRLKAIEAPLVSEIKRIDDAKEAAKQAEIKRRMDLLTANGFQLVNGFYVCGVVNVHGEELFNITEQQLDFYVQTGQAEIERQKAEKQRQEAEAARLKSEQEELAREKAELAKMKAEIEAQKKAMEKAYGEKIEAQHSPGPQQAEPQAQAPTPAPQATTPKPAPAAPQAAAPTVSPQYLAGFEQFRQRLFALVNSDDKLSKAILREWAQSQKP
jgi:hypothetical protein